MSIIVSKGLVIASTVLLLIYGADVVLTFLPVSAMVRGIAFGASPVVMLSIAYFVSRRERSNLVTSLLLFNGAVIIAGLGIVLATQGSSQQIASSGLATFIGTIALGGWILALGIIKGLRTRALTNP